MVMRPVKFVVHRGPGIHAVNTILCKKTNNNNNALCISARRCHRRCGYFKAILCTLPAELSGVYTKDEMAQSTQEDLHHDCISLQQAKELSIIIEQCDPKYQEIVSKYLKKNNLQGLHQISLKDYEPLLNAACENKAQYQESMTLNVQAIEDFTKAMDGE